MAGFLRFSGGEVHTVSHNTEDVSPASENEAIPLTYVRLLKNVRGETPLGFTMIARPIVDPIHSDSASLLPAPPARP